MDFSRIHASGTSKILAKGQQYSPSSGLRRVVFTDVWGFQGDTKYLDATCLLYKGKTLVDTVDYGHTSDLSGAVMHSGDMMGDQEGTHTIHIDLAELPDSITSCVFVISAWSDATLADIISPSISFEDADAGEGADPLCVYNLDSHDKIAHLTSVIMCKLYRRDRAKGWHVLAIGDSHRGAVDNYGPIYKAVQRLL
jgi:stress response protein SCP2